jgi:UDP-N-acetylglucosamine 1-carboxyvinyltransferase
MGCRLEIGEDTVRLRAPEKSLRSVDIVTEPYPGFPTDLQAQFMALLCRAVGTGVITETIYPDRFTHVPELRRLGAHITLSGNAATVTGVACLQGASVMSTDIRASSALILGGLTADGWTRVSRIYHIDRGYERIDQKLSRLGARVRRVPEGTH